MDEYEDIETAARHRDWQRCARIMFGLLYRCGTDAQRDVAAAALTRYVEIWKTKHEGVSKSIPEQILTNRTNRNRPPLPEFPEDLDLADAEFENGLIEFYNGAFFLGSHARRTGHFATAIRSSVTARQINRWLRDHPDDYVQWKAGRGFDAPTFLDDDAAADEAHIMWKFVEAELKKQTPMRTAVRSSKRISLLYEQWEASIL